MYVGAIPNRGACIILQLKSLAPCLHFIALTDADLDPGIIIIFNTDDHLDGIMRAGKDNYMIMKCKYCCVASLTCITHCITH